MKCVKEIKVLEWDLRNVHLLLYIEADLNGV